MSTSGRSYKFLKNKYLICIVVFVVWMSFFDVKDWGLLIERHNKISELEKSEKMLSEQIQETRAELNLLRSYFIRKKTMSSD